MKQLLERIDSRRARIGVIGQGYVGLPLALVFCEAGFPVVGFDLDPAKVTALNRGESYIKHIGPERVAAAVAGSRYRATADFDLLAECDAILICVPTPLGPHREPDNSYIHATGARDREAAPARAARHPRVHDLPRHHRGGGAPDPRAGRPALPGRLPPRLLAGARGPGAQGLHDEEHPKVVGGVNAVSTEVAAALYRAALDHVVPVSNAGVAESAKLLENVFRSVNIALVNELKVIFDRMDIDVWEVIGRPRRSPSATCRSTRVPGWAATASRSIPFYLSWKAAEHGEWARFIELAGEINTGCRGTWSRRSPRR